jgi:serine/threonine-protein kinase HipA
VMGEGKNPGSDVLVKLGREAKISQSTIKAIMEQTKNALSNWPKHAATYGVSRSNIALIKSKIDAVDA